MPHSPGATLGAASLVLLAAAYTHPARAADPAHSRPMQSEPTQCNAYTSDRVDESLWTRQDFKPEHGQRLMEVRWMPEPDKGPDMGHVECSYAPYMSRFPYPTLIGRFAVRKPVTPGWMQPSPQVDWLLCSGATMTRFDDPAQCPFVPADAPDRDGSSAGTSPF